MQNGWRGLLLYLLLPYVLVMCTFLIKLSPVSSLWELSVHAEPTLSTHAKSPRLSSLPCPLCYWKWVLFLRAASRATYVTSPTPLIFLSASFVKTQIFPSFFHSSQDLELLRHRNHSSETPCHRGWPASLSLCPQPLLVPSAVVPEAMPELGVGSYMEGEHLIPFFIKNCF